MINKILTYKYSPFLLAIIIFLWYLPNVTPGYTWISAGVDSFDFIFAAKYHLVPHSTGFPVYMIPANLILMAFPTVHPAWLLALTLSTIPTVITGILVHYSVKELIKDWDVYPKTHVIPKIKQLIDYKRWVPYVAQLTFYGSVVVLSQTFIVEVYTFSTMIAMFVLYFHITKQYKLAALFIGLAVGSHGLIWTMVFFLFLIFWKTYIRKLWIIIPAALIPYLYLPIGLHFTNIEEANVLTENSFRAYYDFFVFGSSTFWWGSLPIWGVPERLWDTAILWTVTLGLGSLSLILYLKNDLKKTWWIVLVIGPTLYYWFGTAVQVVYVHLSLAIPVIIILAALGIRYSKIHPKYYAIVAIITIATIPFYWNLGENLDEKEAAQTYYNFLNTIENTDNHVIVNIAFTNTEHNGEVETLLTDGVAVWWAVLMFNRLNDKHLIPISPNKFLYQEGSNTPDLNRIRLQKSIEYQNAINTVFDLNTVDAIILKDEVGTGWHVNLNGNRISIPLTIYDPCAPSCANPGRNIFQVQLWWFIDRLKLANPDKTIHLTQNIGREDKDIIDKIYTRNLLPPDIKQAIDNIYMEAGLKRISRSSNKSNLYHINN
jgi:hypothetical protein